IDYNAQFANDGMCAEGNGAILELAISGLSPGKHTVSTFHNIPAANWQPGTFEVSLNGAVAVKGVKQSVRIESDDDAPSAFIEVDAVAGKDVVLQFKPDGSSPDPRIILNGVEIDKSNPAKRAIKPLPGDTNIHDDAAKLTWISPAGVTKH